VEEDDIPKTPFVTQKGVTYNFDLYYRKGKIHDNADGMGRMYGDDEEEPNDIVKVSPAGINVVNRPNIRSLMNEQGELYKFRLQDQFMLKPRYIGPLVVRRGFDNNNISVTLKNGKEHQLRIQDIIAYKEDKDAREDSFPHYYDPRSIVNVRVEDVNLPPIPEELIQRRDAVQFRVPLDQHPPNIRNENVENTLIYTEEGQRLSTRDRKRTKRYGIDD
jgi:hypothetical protein